jgi:hypothetical protein
MSIYLKKSKSIVFTVEKLLTLNIVQSLNGNLQHLYTVFTCLICTVINSDCRGFCNFSF